MRSFHTEPSHRIMSVETRVSIHKILGIAQYGIVGAILSYSIFAILSSYNLGSVTVRLGTTNVDPEGVWAFFGGVAGLFVGTVITRFSSKD